MNDVNARSIAAELAAVLNRAHAFHVGVVVDQDGRDYFIRWNPDGFVRSLKVQWDHSAKTWTVGS